jgi:antibiotic biosynthesis monooxygenase (ABM) superfamily enzyme
MHYSQVSETLKKVSMPTQSQRTITGHEVEGEATGSVARQPVVKPKHWKLYLLTVAALYPLTLLIPEVLRIISHLIPALREGVVRGILSSALLVASVMFVIIPFCSWVFKKWLNS